MIAPSACPLADLSCQCGDELFLVTLFECLHCVHVVQHSQCQQVSRGNLLSPTTKQAYIYIYISSRI